MHLFFDLDGTLTDSREGIARCMQYALGELGAHGDTPEAINQQVGPALHTSFANLLRTSDVDRLDLAVATFRQRFEQVGMFENAVYPGIETAIEEFAVSGFTLLVVTAKPRVYARRILEHFNLAHRFSGVYGPELAHRGYSKESLIRQACAEEHVVARETVMIGDRAEDILGAKRNGLLSIGALWGYGGRVELESAQADYLVESSDELVALVRKCCPTGA
jgi:phosphoglycolate phosphatase